jgi:hypothetical protein
MSEEIIHRVSGQNIPVSFEAKVEIDNPKVTRFNATAYNALLVKEFKRPYLIAEAETVRNTNVNRSQNTVSFTAVVPQSAIIEVNFETGSWKHRHGFTLFLQADSSVGVKNIEYRRKDGTMIPLTLKNLRLLNKLSDDQLAEVEAEIKNSGWELSKYHPVRTLYYYFVKVKEG